MLSMDGPNTKWKVYENLKSHGTEKEFFQIMDVGLCGLRVVHGAFQAGMKANEWKLEKVLKPWGSCSTIPQLEEIYTLS